jgi:hypothetical protein
MKNKILLALKIIMSGILLTYLFTIIPFSEILSSFKSAEIIFVLLGVILAAPINYLSALETNYLTKVQGMTLSVFEILKIHLITSFYGFFLPGTLSGGAVKWYKFSKHGNKSSAAAVVVFNRFLETFIIVFLGMFFSFPVLSGLGDNNFIPVWILFFLAMVLIYFLLLNRTSLNFIDKAFLSLPVFSLIKEKISKLIHSMKQFQNLKLKDHFEIIALMLLYHGLGFISFYCFAKSLNINVSIWVIGWVRSAMAIAIMLPFSFAGIGIREGTLVFLLGQYGVEQSDSMALSFLFLFRSLLTSLVGGFIEFKDFTFSKKLKTKETAEIS